jgi:hypothetical protein
LRRCFRARAWKKTPDLRFFSGGLEKLFDPLLLPDMPMAAERNARALKNREK